MFQNFMEQKNDIGCISGKSGGENLFYVNLLNVSDISQTNFRPCDLQTFS